MMADLRFTSHALSSPAPSTIDGREEVAESTRLVLETGRYVWGKRVWCVCVCVKRRCGVACGVESIKGRGWQPQRVV